MSPGRVLHGEEEFIALLADSNVDPELLMNENVKSKLINYNNGITSNEEKGFTKKSSEENNDSENHEIMLTLPPRPKSVKRKFAMTQDGVADANDADYDESNRVSKRKRQDDDDGSINDDMIDSEE